METEYYPECYLGIDGGGTKTRVAIIDSTGLIFGEGEAGSANRNHYTADQARENLREAILSACRHLPQQARLSAVYCAMSGVSTDSDRQEVLALIRSVPEIGPETCVAVDNDAVAGLTGGLAGRPGLVLIAGTGSACLGIDGNGAKRWCGGWGALADDAGSAPWVGLRAIQTAVRAEDGRAEPTVLLKIVLDFLGLSEPRQLIHRVHNQGFDRAEMGGLAPAVVAAAQSGDAAAVTILSEAAAELSSLASVVAHHLFGTDTCEMILVGGFARSGHPFQALLMDRLHRDVPQLKVVEPVLTPVQGAVLEALRLGGRPWTEQILNTLAASELEK